MKSIQKRTGKAFSLPRSGSVKEGLPLGELEAFPGFGPAGFFPFHHAGVAGKVPGLFHGGTEAVSEARYGAGYTVANGAGLAGYAAAVNFYHAVEFLVFSQDEGRGYHVPEAGIVPEIGLGGFGVYRYLAFPALGHAYLRHGGLAPAGG